MNNLARDPYNPILMMPTTILIIPGFVIDTYSEIEASYIDLCTAPDDNLRFLWLVPGPPFEHNSFVREDRRAILQEPVWVKYLRDRDIPYIVANIHKYNPLANYVLFRRLFREQDIDAVYTHFGFERFWATFFTKYWGKKTIWNEHWHSLGRKYSLAKRIFYRAFVDRFISVSKFITKTLPRSSIVYTVPNAIGTELPRALTPGERAQIRERLCIQTQITVILMVAAFRDEKQHFVALDIATQVLRKRFDIMFIFLGEGETRTPFLQEIARRGLDSRIQVPGHVDNVDDYYAISDICMLTSRDEPFGYCVLEAMKYSLPQVTFASGGPGEILRNGETGVLVDDGKIHEFARQLLNLIEDRSKRRAIGNRALRAVQEEFSRPVWIKNLRVVLQQSVTCSEEALKSRTIGNQDA
jgi:L-malate glycosyltransferase